jgi:hypothetical protein
MKEKKDIPPWHQSHFKNYIERNGILKFSKNPEISGCGSGKITRRYLVIPGWVFYKSVKLSIKMKKSDNWKNGVKEYYEKRKNGEIKKLNFPSVAHKNIFQVWKSSGFPFQNHRLEQNKTTLKSIDSITKFLKKYEMREIIEAIEIGNRVFNSEWFKFHWKFKYRKVPLHTFFQYDPKDHEMQSKRNPDLPLSWLGECIKGEKYMRNKYSLTPATDKDRLPESTKLLVKGFTEYHRGRQYNLDDIEFLNTMSKWCLYLFNFSRINNISFLFLRSFVIDAMIKYKTITIRKAFHLVSKSFYRETLVEALLKRDPNGYRDKKWNFDWDEIIRPVPKKMTDKQIENIFRGIEND